MLLLLLLGFNGPATEAEPQIIVMKENEIHIRKGEGGKVDKEIGFREGERWEAKKQSGWVRRKEVRRGERGVGNERFLCISDLLG